MDLGELYFSINNPASFRGAGALYAAAKARGLAVTFEQVKKWLSRFDTYTFHKPVRYKYPRLRTVSYSYMDLVQVCHFFTKKLFFCLTSFTHCRLIWLKCPTCPDGMAG